VNSDDGPGPMSGLGAKQCEEWAHGSITKVAYRIHYARPTEQHFAHLSRIQQRAVLDAVDRQLKDQPAVQTRNRKRMRPNPMATWELRIGNLRVYYDVLSEPEATVLVVAVGVKERSTLRIGGEVVIL
jgi:mRNA-degrading endonuclease RelE of RelBE toxin-antitoxin system